MAIRRWDPVRELIELQQKMNRLFEETFARSAGPASSVEPASSAWKPSADLFEDADRYVLQADLPGVAAGDVDIRVEGGQLMLRGERRRDGDVAREAYLRVERPAGRFLLQVSLAPSVDTEAIRATHHNGVLEIVLPKKKIEAPSQVEILAR